MYSGDNENCTDARRLFEHVVATPSDLLRGGYVKYFKGHNRTKVRPNLDDGILSQLDHEVYGR